ncbi:MAG: curli assembly protein CsgF, partial [Moraxellaceae bacterium]
MKKISRTGKNIALLCALAASTTHASPLVYTPVNPAFGGNPLNGSYLLSNAQAQNDTKDPSARSSTGQRQSAIERFMSSLESRLLGELLSDVGGGGEGHMETTDFIIDIADDGAGGLLISVTDRATGSVSVVEVSGLVSNP